MITTIIKIAYFLLVFTGGAWLAQTGQHKQDANIHDAYIFCGLVFAVVAFVCLTITIMTLKP